MSGRLRLRGRGVGIGVPVLPGVSLGVGVGSGGVNLGVGAGVGLSVWALASISAAGSRAALELALARRSVAATPGWVWASGPAGCSMIPTRWTREYLETRARRPRVQPIAFALTHNGSAAGEFKRAASDSLRLCGMTCASARIAGRIEDEMRRAFQQRTLRRISL